MQREKIYAVINQSDGKWINEWQQYKRAKSDVDFYNMLNRKWEHRDGFILTTLHKYVDIGQGIKFGIPI